MVACVLLALIGADLVGDANCDLPLTLNVEAGTRLQSAVAPDGTNEACFDFCVPDCFCCSRSVAAGPAIVPPAPVPLSLVEDSARETGPEGVRPVVDHPPHRLV